MRLSKNHKNTTELFEHILNKARSNRMVDPSAAFMDGAHIKAGASKKFQREVNAERESLGKKPIEEDYDDTDNRDHPSCLFSTFLQSAMKTHAFAV